MAQQRVHGGVTPRRLCGEAVQPCHPHGLGLQRPLRAGGPFLVAQRGAVRLPGRRRVQGQRRPILRQAGIGVLPGVERGPQHDRGLVGGGGVDQRLPEQVRRRGVDEQRAAAHLQFGAPLRIGAQPGDRRELRHVEQLETDRGVRGGGPVGVRHRDGQAGDGGVGVGEVLQQRVILLPGGGANIDGAGGVVAEHAGVHEHGAGRGAVEPATVQPLLGFAGAHEPPHAVDHRLDPGVVVVAVGPARRVDLSRGHADGQQRGHQQRGLLAAAADAAVQRAHRAERAPVGGRVGDVFGAPVVGFDNRPFHVQPGDARVQLAGDRGAAGLQPFVVDTWPEDVVDEDVFGQRGSPGARAPQHQRVVGVSQQRFRAAVQDVGERQGADHQLHQGSLVGVEVRQHRVGGDRPSVDRRDPVLMASMRVLMQRGGEQGGEHGHVLVVVDGWWSVGYWNTVRRTMPYMPMWRRRW